MGTYIFFNNKNLDYNHEDYNLHSYIAGEIEILPKVGDVVDFDDDAFFEPVFRLNLGTRFIIKQRVLHFHRMEGCRDECSIEFIVDPYDYHN
jgi:hypothetical protein